MAEKSRKWLITYNLEKSTVGHLEEQLSLLNVKSYIIGAIEIGQENEYKHLHLYIEFQNARSFKTIQNIFKIHHIEQAYGSLAEIKTYLSKDGEFIKDTTNDLVLEIEDQIIEDIMNGSSWGYIIKKYPKYAIRYYSNLKSIYDDLQQQIKEEKKEEFINELGELVEYEK